MPTSRSFQQILKSLERSIKEVDGMISTVEERRALGRMLGNGLIYIGARGEQSKGQLPKDQASGIYNLGCAVGTALKGQPAPKAILHHLLRAMKELDLLP